MWLNFCKPFINEAVTVICSMYTSGKKIRDGNTMHRSTLISFSTEEFCNPSGNLHLKRHHNCLPRNGTSPVSITEGFLSHQ